MCYFSSHVPLDRTGSVDSPSNYHEFIFLYLFWHLFLPLISVCKQSSLFWTLLCLKIELTIVIVANWDTRVISKSTTYMKFYDIILGAILVSQMEKYEFLQHSISRRFLKHISLSLSRLELCLLLSYYCCFIQIFYARSITRPIT